jgi:Ser/Thr protein kinase RdoA (MazF antagonist)
MTDPSVQLALRFGLGDVRGFRQVGRGAMGAVWRLDSSVGTFAAKEAFWEPPEEEHVLQEVAFRNDCAAAGVPSPQPLPSTTGEYVVHLDGLAWRLFEWCDGAVVDHGDVPTTAWLAAQMGTIHALAWSTGDDPEPHEWYGVVDVDWPTLAAKAAAAQVDWAAGLRHLTPRLAELAELVNSAPIGDPVWCHRDLTNTNVLRSAAGRTLIDWDNVGPLAPWRELGALLTHHLKDETGLRTITAAYREAGGTAVIDGPATFATALAISLNFLHGQATAAMDEQLDPAHREYAASKVFPLLASIPDLETLERASQAVRR